MKGFAWLGQSARPCSGNPASETPEACRGGSVLERPASPHEGRRAETLSGCTTISLAIIFAGWFWMVQLALAALSISKVLRPPHCVAQSSSNTWVAAGLCRSQFLPRFFSGACRQGLRVVMAYWGGHNTHHGRCVLPRSIAELPAGTSLFVRVCACVEHAWWLSLRLPGGLVG